MPSDSSFDDPLFQWPRLYVEEKESWIAAGSKLPGALIASATSLIGIIPLLRLSKYFAKLLTWC